MRTLPGPILTRLIAVALVVVSGFTLAGCGSSSKSPKKSKTATAATTTTATTATTSTTKTTPAPPKKPPKLTSYHSHLGTCRAKSLPKALSTSSIEPSGTTATIKAGTLSLSITPTTVQVLRKISAIIIGKPTTFSARSRFAVVTTTVKNLGKAAASVGSDLKLGLLLVTSNGKRYLRSDLADTGCAGIGQAAATLSTTTKATGANILPGASETVVVVFTIPARSPIYLLSVPQAKTQVSLKKV